MKDRIMLFGPPGSGKVLGFKARVLVIANVDPGFSGVTPSNISTLYDIVMHEHEGFDGEEVSESYMVKLMIERYNAMGMAPSRN